MALALVVGGVWWAQDDAPSPGPAAVAAGAPPGDTGDAARPSVLRSPSPPATAKPKPDPTPKPKPDPKAKPKPDPKPKAKPAPEPKPPPAPLAPSPATRLAVPAITIEAPVVGLGLDESGRLLSPPVDDPLLVGWYEDGPTPGEKGTAVAVGHRDTRTGPAVFLDLNSLKPGNTVRVTRKDGLVAVYTVDRVRTYDKDRFPDQEVYGATGRPELRLLTCGGSFDRKKGYAANVVAFAHLTDVIRAA
ncbi:class F sortase [Streptomyces sp. TRM64462]|uniref:class F sortase n=1 Tax=Streptomyces sp. TRM64462 TaxID=2741726 RepID=UPI002814AEA1|nr:class F sortase [Streptomyces sp. TRM64462]